MSTRRQARRRVAGRRHHHSAVAGYAAGVWLAVTLWMILAQHALPSGHRLADAQATWLALMGWSGMPAALGAFGYAVGLSWCAPSGPLPWPAQVRRAIGAGLWFALALGVLVALLAWTRSGLWLAALACVLGSTAVAIVQTVRAEARPDLGQPSRVAAS